MLAKTICFIIIFLLITGVVVWILASFNQEAIIEDKINRIEVYDADAAEPSATITDKNQVEDILECINECERKEMHETASYASFDETLILYGNENEYEVGIWQGGGAVSFVYGGMIITGNLESFLL
ncbi:hypothetical protein SAMN05421663_10517 [Terribacillus halophilus]|uniref:Uncharacterized protein n=1 Tax=Terribacillus halophilus TaxID=361279 RepID=A0A1G6QBB9_9BACI|nr:hypothetical protein [Terribacillus halophilus]SDC89782.1 hypothetical protein SAMN05421663_10517 [Terribacillus halophilus]